MRILPISRNGITTRLTAATALVCTASLLMVGALQAPAGAAPSGPFSTITTVTASPPSLSTGQSVTLTAKVSAGPHGTPAGTVTFAGVTCDGGNAVALAAGLAGCTVSSGLIAGSSPYSVSAIYTDTADSTFLTSTGTRSVAVKFGKTATALTSSVNPSVTGQPVSFTAAVSAVSPAVGTPSGTVLFTGVTCDGGTNSLPLSGGLAQCMISGGLSAQVAPMVIGAAYSGDSGFATSTATVKQTVARAAATVTLAVNPNNCVGDLCTVGQGIPVTFTGTAASTGTDNGAGVPTGSLSFSIIKAGSKVPLVCDGGTSTIPLVSGQAVCSLVGGLLSSVYYTVTATLVSTGYSAPSATLYENSSLVGTSTSIGTLHSIGAGQSFTVTATVTQVGPSANTPGGYVNVVVCGSNSNGNNGCQGGAVPVGAGGIAQFSVGGGEFPGSYSITAVYTGDANFYSSSAPVRHFAVIKSDTSLSLNQFGGFATVSGDAATITATVSTPNGAAGSTLVGPPTGTVTFTITDPGGAPVNCAGGNSVTLGSGLNQVEGTATCFLPPGSLTTVAPASSTYSIHVNYGGDFDYGSSNASTSEIVVPVAV